jgi:hypothetical protein
MIIFMEDRKFTGDLKNPKDVALVFDQMLDEFREIRNALVRMFIAFLDKDWNLQEGQAETLQAYFKAAEEIRNCLTNLTNLNAKLDYYLRSETRPINLPNNTTQYFNMQIDALNKELRLYYQTVRGTLFPRFDDERKQCRDIIVAINGNIDRINEINAAHRIRPLRHTKNLRF